MTQSISLERLLQLLECEPEFVEECIAQGVLERAEAYGPDDLERVRVTRVLVRELEVNWPGVDIILRMRQELVEMRRSMDELVAYLREREATADRDH